jgi:hypothetical protein
MVCLVGWKERGEENIKKSMNEFALIDILHLT